MGAYSNMLDDADERWEALKKFAGIKPQTDNDVAVSEVIAKAAHEIINLIEQEISRIRDERDVLDKRGKELGALLNRAIKAKRALDKADIDNDLPF